MNITVPPISLVIPTRGEKGDTLTASLLQSLYDTHGFMKNAIEVIVVQDGVDDVAEARLRRALEDYPLVKIMVNDRPGFAKACNMGIVASSGAYVFLCNNDITFEDNALQKLFVFGRATGAGVIAPKLLYPDRTVQHGGVVYVRTNNPEIPGYFDHQARGAHEWSPEAVDIRVGLVTGALFGISRGALDMVGLLDERFGFSCEDIDYCLRVIECGMTVQYCGIIHAIHMEGASRGRTLEEKMEMAPEVALVERDALADLHKKWAGIGFDSFNPR